MGEVFEEVTGLGPVGVEDLFLINSNEETSVPKTLKFDEADPFEILLDVFEDYTEESILSNAIKELKTTTPGRCQTKESFSQEQVDDSLANMESLVDLEQMLCISEFTCELEQNMKSEEQTTELIEYDDAFFGSLLDEDILSDIKSDSSKIANTGSSTDCIDSSYVFSDTTEVITSSDLLAKLMSESGIPVNENSTTANTESRKRSSSSDFVDVPEKAQKYSETDADECLSMYSSCASSPENKCAIRRLKNNEASKVSRANRKAKQQRLFDKEKELEKDNDRLRQLIQEMSSEAETLRKILVDKLSGVKC